MINLCKDTLENKQLVEAKIIRFKLRKFEKDEEIRLKEELK